MRRQRSLSYVRTKGMAANARDNHTMQCLNALIVLPMFGTLTDSPYAVVATIKPPEKKWLRQRWDGDWRRCLSGDSNELRTFTAAWFECVFRNSLSKQDLVNANVQDTSLREFLIRTKKAQERFWCCLRPTMFDYKVYKCSCERRYMCEARRISLVLKDCNSKNVCQCFVGLLLCFCIHVRCMWMVFGVWYRAAS